MALIIVLHMRGIKQILYIWLVVSLFDASVCNAQKSDALTTYAQTRLSEALRNQPNGPFTNYRFDLKIDSVHFAKEAYEISVQNKLITVTGGDKNGLIYGTLGLINDMKNGVQPSQLHNKSEQAHYTFRAIKYDLPWDSYRRSEALRIHMETCKDLNYWEKFLDMMVENRFNALTLWNLHPYTFMIMPKNYPEASSFSKDEMDSWKKLYHGILGMAKERGIDTYIGSFNIFVSPEFSKAHNLAVHNPERRSSGIGDTTALVRNYTRECVTQVLQEYPELDGFGFTLGEAMGGMTTAQREEWMHQTIYEGIRLSGRKAKLIHRIPLSSDTNPTGSTSLETEVMTRKILDADGDLEYIQGPIMADFKYNWSHGHSSPKLIKVHGGKLYDTYFKPNPTAYKILWTVRNEDFFCLRWGSPDFIKSHIAENNQDFMGGYMIGSETYIPAKDYFTKQPEGVNFTYAFERQWYFYKTWGRLLYNPDTPLSVFENEFKSRFGKYGKSLFESYNLASKTPLVLASIYNFTWDGTLYSEGFLGINPATKNLAFITIEMLINQPPLDPNFISIKEYVSSKLENKSFAGNKNLPPDVAQQLEADGLKSLSLLGEIDYSQNPTLMYEVSDAKIWSYLGLYLSTKIYAGIALETFRITGNATKKSEAVALLQKALNYWDEVVKISKPLYKEMPLIHLGAQKNPSPDTEKIKSFHWANLRTYAAQDIEIARNMISQK